jgi:preprotein translocase subunit SecD
MGSCSIFKKQKEESPHKAYTTATATDVQDQNSVSSTSGGFRPFTVDRVDGFYEVISFTQPYPYSDVVLGDHPLVSRAEIKEAKAGLEQYQNHPIVDIEFTKEGARKFGKITEENIGKPIAIVVGGKVVSMPVVQGIISGGKVHISGGFSMEEVVRMAKIFNAR